MEKLKIGVIGLGKGKSHIQSFNTHPAAEVIAVADVDKKRLNEIGKKEFNIPNCYLSAEELLTKHKFDIVSIAVPNAFHKDLTIMAIKAGSHVICEKPMSMNAAEALEMLETAEKYNKRIMINFGYRFTEQAYALKKQIESGIVGDIYFARTRWFRRRGMSRLGSWFTSKKLSGGGPLIDLGVHRLDLALWLMNYPKPVWVMASTYDHIVKKEAEKQDKYNDVEDTGIALIKFENGATIELEASWAINMRKSNDMSTHLFGTKGGAIHANIDGGFSYEAEMCIEKEGCQINMKLQPPFPVPENAMYHFVECIIENKPHSATGEEGLIIMKIVDAIYKSAETGLPVKIQKG